MTIRVGLVGYGLAGRFLHAPVIAAAGLEIAAVVTSRSADVVSDWPGATVLSDFGALLATDDIDLVVITTPNALHFPQAKAALEAGRHVVVEKPFTVTVEEADALVDLAEDCGLCLSAYQNRRWDSDFLTLRRLIDEGALGDLVAFHMRWDRFRPEVQDRWRDRDVPGAGLLHDLGPHLIDQALTLVGWPDWIQADVFAQRKGSVVDDGFEILMGRGRARVTLGVSSIAADGGWRYRVNGDRASVLKTGLDVQESQLREGMKPDAPGFGVEPEDQWGELVDGDRNRRRIPSETGSWVTFYRQMAAAIAAGSPPPVPAREAADVIRIIAAARASATTGRRIDLKRDKDAR